MVRLEIPNSAQYVTVARKAVEGIGSRMSLTEEQVQDLKLVVGEACTNAVKFSPCNSPVVYINYRVSPDTLEIEIRNSGDGFCTQNVPNMPPIESLPEGGMGIYVIRQIMDEVDIKSEYGETTVRMLKRFGTAAVR